MSILTEADILARVQEVFRAELDNNDLIITMTTTQEDLPKWDSLAHVRLISGMESEFDIEFSLVEIEDIASVRDFVNTTKMHLAE